MAGIQPDWFVEVPLLGRRVYAHLVPVPLPLIPDLPLGYCLARDKQLGVHCVQIPRE